MPNRIAYYECNYCKKRFNTHDEAVSCEDTCLRNATCTFCGQDADIGSLRHVKDAAGVDHRLCKMCREEICSIGNGG